MIKGSLYVSLIPSTLYICIASFNPSKAMRGLIILT